MRRFNSKKLVFIAVMSALGNILAGISIYLGPISPGVALDLSHVATFIAAIYGGPVIGFLVGLFGGIFSGVYFGPLGNLSWLGLIGLPLGKSLTGLTTASFYRLFNVKQRSRQSILTLLIVFFSYIPECLFTVFFFLNIMPYFLGLGGGLTMLWFILPKAWGEITLMSFLMAALVGNEGFSTFIATSLASYKTRLKS